MPAHFPTDVHGLARFDGTPLYEHADPRRGFQPDWNTAIYDFGRREVANVLIASALYWLDRYPYRRAARRCGRLDALPRLFAQAGRVGAEPRRRQREPRRRLRSCGEPTTLVYAEHPGIVMIAEESTAWAGVSQPVDAGGLGFGFKWNMGWMHDTLDYVSQSRCIGAGTTTR